MRLGIVNKYWSKRISFFAIALCLSCSKIYADETKFDLNIERQALGDALIEISKRMDRPFFIRISLVEGIKSNELKGSYTFADALSALLKGTGLKGELTDAGQIRITRDHGYYNSDYEPVAVVDEVILEEVIVSGVRYAWLTAADVEKNSVTIKDVLTEQDMNKLPDGNIADSLQRINGVQIERRNGDGTKFRIRGFDKNLTLYNNEVFLTGLEYFQLGLAEQSYENSVETVPVELLRRIEVSKSVKASDIEGAIGGTVNLVSRNAFDVEDYLITMDLKGDYGIHAKDNRPEAFLGLGKNFNNEVSALFTANYSERTMHMDTAQNYIDPGLEDSFQRATLETYKDGETELDYIAPAYSSVSDLEQTRQQTGVSLNLGWRPSSMVELQFEWFGIYNEFKQRNYEMYFGIDEGISSNYQFNTRYPLTFLQSVDYEAGAPTLRTIAESFTTKADNINIKADIELSTRLTSKTVLSGSTSTFTQALGSSDLITIADARTLPVWIGDNPYPIGDGDEATSPTGWVRYLNLCEECLDPDNFLHDWRYDNSLAHYANFEGTEAYLFRAEDTFGASNQAKGSGTEQNLFAIKSDLIYHFSDNRENNIAFGFRLDRHTTEFSQNRYLTNFSATNNAANPTRFDEEGNVIIPSTFDPSRPGDDTHVGLNLPVFYDLCQNGGLDDGNVCDINGDFIDDNLPYGPWISQLDPTMQWEYFSLNGENFISQELYGQYFSSINLPGFIPRRDYSQFPQDYVTLRDFYPTGSLPFRSATFIDGDRISRNVETWIDAMSPNSPTKRFNISRNSWNIEQQTSAFYTEVNLQSDRVPMKLNAGVRYVETHLTTERFVVENGTGYSLTPQPWYVSGIGGGWHQEEVKTHYSHWLPSANVTYEFSDAWQLRLAVSKTIARPSFFHLGQGEDPRYEFTFDFEQFPPQAYYQADTMTTGNPDLEPVRILQGDVSIEHYGEQGNLFQLAIFYKDITGQIFKINTPMDVKDESPQGFTEVYASMPVNGDKNYAKGLELTLQKTWLTGFGLRFDTSVNDTDSDIKSLTHDDLGLPGVSKHTVNLSGFYENDRLSAQLTYTWRDEFLSPYNSLIVVDLNDNDNFIELAQIYEAYGQWDARFLYFVNSSLTLSLDLINITEAEQESYLEFPDNSQSHSTWEPRAVFGLKIDF